MAKEIPQGKLINSPKKQQRLCCKLQVDFFGSSLVPGSVSTVVVVLVVGLRCIDGEKEIKMKGERFGDGESEGESRRAAVIECLAFN